MVGQGSGSEDMVGGGLACSLGVLLESIHAWMRVFPDEGRTVRHVVGGLWEELTEFTEEIERGNRKRAAHELADVLFVAIKAYYLLGLDATAMEEVAAKNLAKTRSTHYVAESGKVIRRPG